MITLSPQDVRRLAVAAQRLEIPAARPTRADILDTIRQITCVQIDPINVVARTQLLVPYSRLGAYDPAELESLLWEDKALFEYWA
ncbi:MAG: crosslink repair DNA glycosylase YcaQ family protein, partial [Chloroflexota bacterium]